MGTVKRKSLTNGSCVKKRIASKPPFHALTKCYSKLVEYLDIKSIATLEIALVKCLLSECCIDNTNYRKTMFDYASNETFIKWVLKRKLCLKHIIVDGSYYNEISLVQNYINCNRKIAETVRLISLDDLTDEIVLKLISNCPCISSIYINDCNLISNHFVSSLLFLKPHLLSLSIIHCSKITYGIVKSLEKFRNLRKITLNDNVITNDVDYNKISTLPKLRRFNLIENILDNENKDNFEIDDEEEIWSDNNDGDSNNSLSAYSIDSVNTYTSDSDSDSASNDTSSNDIDDNRCNILDYNESSISLDTVDSDSSCPLLIYN